MSKAIFGIEALDKMISDALRFPSLVVVAGHPGAGKTTLASSICYANALKNLKCLYLSFQEDKEKTIQKHEEPWHRPRIHRKTRNSNLY
ncbi:MAG: ATPase domain-containing protein [Ignisphaera sp.]